MKRTRSKVAASGVSVTTDALITTSAGGSSDEDQAAEPEQSRSRKRATRMLLIKAEDPETVVASAVRVAASRPSLKTEADSAQLVKAELAVATPSVYRSTSHAPSPYNWMLRPTAEECVAARNLLCQLHGEPMKEKLELQGTLLEKRSQTVLDSLVRTILSQNTTDILSSRAFESLKRSFPTYARLLAAPDQSVEESIKVGGLAAIKVERIKTILRTVLRERPQDCENGEPSLEYMRSMPTEAIKEELSRLKGVGPKTISCVLMFTLGRPEFPVDTHVWHIAKRLGWVPNRASREDTYAHLNSRVPDAVKYDLHVLLVQHGKKCRSCAKGNRQLQQDGPCPLTPEQIKGAVQEILSQAAAASGGDVDKKEPPL